MSWTPPATDSLWKPPAGDLPAWKPPATDVAAVDPNEASMQAKMQQGMTQGPTSLLAQKFGPGEMAMGMAEQGLAGIQAGANVAEKIYGGIKGLLDPESTAAAGARQQQEEFAKSPASKILTPRTEAGQNIAAFVGSGIGKAQEALQDPEFQEKYLGKTIAHGPIGASIAAFAEMAPDLAIAYGLKPGKAKPSVKGLPEKLEGITPEPNSPTGYEPGKYTPPNEPTVSTSFDLWKDEADRRLKETTGYEKDFESTPVVKPTSEDGIPFEQGLAPKETYPGFVNPKEDVFQGGGGIPFQLRQEVLDTPELRHAIDSVITMHEDLTAQIGRANEKEGLQLTAQRDALEEKFAAEMRRYGITKKSDAYGRALYDTIPDGLWQALRVKIEQQNSRQFAGSIASQSRDGVQTRSVQPGIETPSKMDMLGGHYGDKPIPIIAAGKAFTIKDPEGPRVRQTLDINGILDHIANHGDNPIYRGMAATLRKFNLPDLGVTFNISMDAGGKVMIGTDHKGKVAGSFIIGSKAVVVGMKGFTERTVLHELIHAVTVRAFLGAFKNSTDALLTGKWKVDSSHPLANTASKLISAWKQLQDIAAEHHPDEFMKAGDSGRFYGLTNPLELMAEIGTNPEFMKWVNQQVIIEHGKPTTLLGKIRSVFKDITDEEENALDHVMFHTAQVANAYAQMPAVWDRFYYEAFAREISGRVDTQIGALNHVISQVPGLEHASWLQGVKPFEAVKDTILQEKDGGSKITGEESFIGRTAKEARNNIGKLLAPGYIMAKELAGSTLIQNVGRIMTNAEKRAEMFIERWSDPMEKAVGKLNEPDREALQAVFLKELVHEGRFSVDQLRSIGMTDKQLSAYQAVRDGFDAGIKRINEVRAGKELKPINPLDAYHASRWSGMYRAEVVDAQGKKIWAIAESTAPARQKAMNWITKKYPELSIANQKVVNLGEKVNSLQAGYLEMLDFLDKDDPRTQALKSAYEEMLGTKTENVAGQERHFMIKTGVRGYLGDRPWAQKNATDFFEQQIKYMQGAAKWTEFQQAFEDAKKYTTDQQVRSVQPNNVSYAEEYIKHKMGFGSSKLAAQVENALSGAFGLAPGTLARILSVGKKIFYPLELAVKLPFIEISLLQHGFSAAQHAMLDSRGYVAKNKGYILDAIKYGTQHALLDAKEFGLSANPNIPGLDMIHPMEGYWAAAREYAHANKILDQNPLTEAKDIRSGPTQNTIENIANFTTAVTEKIARGWTFYGLVSHLASSEKFDLKSRDSLKEMFSLAEESTKITMADYDHSERSMLFNKFGMFGKAAAALKTYPTNMVGQLMVYSKEAGKGNPKPLAYFLAMQMAVGGLRGMFAVDDLDAAWSFIKRHLPSSMFDLVKDWGIKKWMVEHLPEMAYHGPISSLTGQNISVQGSMGRVVPGMAAVLEGNIAEAAADVFPAIHENIALGKALGETVAGGVLAHTPAWVPKPTPNETQQSLYEATPTGFKGLMREENPNFKSATRPNLMLNPHDLAEGEYERSQHEHELGKYGFTSPKEQTVVDAAHAFREMKAIMGEHRKEVVRDLEEYALKGNSDQVRRLMILYWDLGGQVDKVPDEINKAALEKITEMRQRAALDMQNQTNPTQVMIARDFLKALSPQ